TEPRNLTFYAGQIGGQDIQLVCSVAHYAGPTPAQALLVVRADSRMTTSMPVGGSVVTMPTVAGDEALTSLDLSMDVGEGLRDIFVMSLTNRPLRRMLDQVFDQAQ